MRNTEIFPDKLSKFQQRLETEFKTGRTGRLLLSKLFRERHVLFNYSRAKPENTEKSQLMIVDKMIVQTPLEVNERERERYRETENRGTERQRETYRDRQTQTATDRDKLTQTHTDSNSQ